MAENSPKGKKTLWKMRSFSLFLTVFSKDSFRSQVKTRASFGKGQRFSSTHSHTMTLFDAPGKQVF